jgi:hypothetical protein
MDGTGHAPATDSPDLFAGSKTGDAFGPRLRRALLTLIAAIVAHQWLIHPPPAGGMAGRVPIALSAVVSRSGLTIAPPVAARQPLSPSARSVQVRSEIINVPVAFEWDTSLRPTTQGLPVPTTGFVRARLEERPETSEQQTADATRPPSLPALRPMQTSEVAVPRPVSIEATELAQDPGVLALMSAAPVVIPEKTLGPAASAADHAAELRKQEEIVRSVLRDYTRAYERLDVQAAKAIWPSLDESALRHAFQQLHGQQLRFASCGVSVTERDANARCRGEATYRPKVGSRVLRLTQREWTFNLARDNDRWQIVNATLQ